MQPPVLPSRGLRSFWGRNPSAHVVYGDSAAVGAAPNEGSIMYEIVFWTLLGGWILSMAVAVRYAYLLERRIYRAALRRQLVAAIYRAHL